MAAVGGLGPASPTTLGLQAHVTHQPLDPASCVSVPLAAQFSVDPGRAIDPALGRKDPADVPAQRGVRLRTVLSGRDRAQPGVEARDADANDPAQRRNGMARSAATKANVLTRSPGRKKPRPCAGSGSRLRAASPRA